MHRKGGSRGQDRGTDSGAETGGSEYSCMSTSVSELSGEEVHDPFLVSVHIIADPGESSALQQTIDNLLAWIYPDLQLFQISERRVPKKVRNPGKAAASQPALAVILFLQEDYDEEPVLQLHEAFQRAPWHYHHTEQVWGNFLPYMPCSQDFFTLAQGTLLWAIRPVHYGKEIIRFTIYCWNETFAIMVKFYELILKRQVCQTKADFCVFPLYSNMDINIQLSLKKLPRGQVPSPTESAVLEFRVKDVGQLVPLLPNPCRLISEGRWQTEDPDGNKILLQKAWYKKSSKQSKSSPSRNLPVAPLPNFVSNSNRWALDKDRDPWKSVASIPLPHSNGCLGVSQQDLRIYDQEHFPRGSHGTSVKSGAFHRSKSLACLPTTSTSPVPEPFHLSEPDSLSMFASGYRARTRVNINDLEGVQETDVDTGMKLAYIDLSVVSAYSIPDGFSKEKEVRGVRPTQEQSFNRLKQAISRGRISSAKCNLFECPSRSFPFLLVSTSLSASLSAAHFGMKCLPRGTCFSFSDSRTTGGGKTSEEEFYI